MKLCLTAILLCLSVLAQANALGIRNRNPGNIRGRNCAVWPGCIGKDSQGHLIFRKPIHGIKAIVINLKIYRDRHKIRTLQGVANRWVKAYPQADKDRYAKILAYQVSKFSGRRITPRSRLNMWDAGTLEAVTRAIIWVEVGKSDYGKEYSAVFPRLK